MPIALQVNVLFYTDFQSSCHAIAQCQFVIQAAVLGLVSLPRWTWLVSLPQQGIDVWMECYLETGHEEVLLWIKGETKQTSEQ
jgi:hypothetical protein